MHEEIIKEKEKVSLIPPVSECKKKEKREDLPLPSLFEQARKIHSSVIDYGADQQFGKCNWVAVAKRVKVMLKVPVVVHLEGTNMIRKEHDLTLLFNLRRN
ncbi:hypothetical protein CFP56_039435 [Quercus suber]|uniref:Uncharacterized protein n=1 Tax=Quercus suber TaxID=58331 RepID=A0AAW0IZZ4_QUESU